MNRWHLLALSLLCTVQVAAESSTRGRYSDSREAKKLGKVVARRAPLGYLDKTIATEAASRRIRYNFSAGVNMLHPMVGFAVAISEGISLGVSPGYFAYRFEGVDASLYGAAVTASYYTTSSYQGVWFQFGGLLYATDVSFGGKRTSVASGGLIATVGHRWLWGNLNLGIAAGAQYFHLPKSSLGVVGWLWWPAALLDVGWAF